MARTYFDLFPQTFVTSLMSLEFREKLQKRRLKKLVTYAKENSPFFAELYKDVNKNFVLADLPPVTKKQMMDNFDDYVTDRAIKKADVAAFLAGPGNYDSKLHGKYVVATTSGSTGLQACVVNDRSSQNIKDALMSVRAFQARIPFAILCSSDGYGITNVTTRDNIKKVPFLKYFLRSFESKKAAAELVEELNKFRPKVICGFPGTLMLLTEDPYAGKLRIKPSIVLTSGEYLTDYSRRKLQETFNCPVHSMYACTEGGFMAFECKKNRLHVNNDWVILEAVDDDFNPVPDGTLSQKTLVTFLGNKVQPIIRYELTDRTILHNERCECGRAGPWIEVEGRTNDMLRFEGKNGGTVTVAPMSFLDIIEEVPGVQSYQVILRGRNKIELRLVPDLNSDINDVCSLIEKRILDYLRYLNVDDAVMYLSDKRPQRDPVSGKFRQIYQEA
ncbi:MAG: phenylacetate--CoA ligase family protein [Clostridiales bacterium]|jgi:phenylacetate-CoA ligase|nr:phenylacetate--CoA ligase family protein [Clostridiales bacterium]